MNVDKEAVPGCWLWLGPVRMQQGHAVPIGDRNRRQAARLVWEEEIGALAPGDKLRKTCTVDLCVNPAHRRLMNASRLREEVLEAFAAGATVDEIAKEVGRGRKRVREILVEEGLLSGRVTLTAAARQRAAQLLAEGLPDRWIAEDVKHGIDVIRKLRASMGIANKDWVRVQLAVRHDPTLAALHNLFNPGPAVGG